MKKRLGMRATAPHAIAVYNLPFKRTALGYLCAAACLAGLALTCSQAAAQNPALLAKIANPAAYDAPSVLEQLRSSWPAVSCSYFSFPNPRFVNDQNGPPAQYQFAQNHKSAVGVMYGGLEGSRYCSGTLISNDLFLTASHCVSARTLGHAVLFNHELVAGYNSAGLVSSSSSNSVIFTVTTIVYDDVESDFAVLHLAGKPGLYFPWTTISSSNDFGDPGTPITIIQHVDGGPKQVDSSTIIESVGPYWSYDATQGSSSGAGILNATGELIGVHTTDGCGWRGEASVGTKITTEIWRSMAPPPFFDPLELPPPPSNPFERPLPFESPPVTMERLDPLEEM